MNKNSENEVTELRGSIQEQAEKTPLPDRFIVEQLDESPSVQITDTLTNKTTKVPMYAYGNVRKVLRDLFEPDFE